MSGVTSVELSFPCQPSYTPTPTPAPCQYQAPSLIPQAERASDTTIDATLFQSKPFVFVFSIHYNTYDTLGMSGYTTANHTVLKEKI